MKVVRVQLVVPPRVAELHVAQALLLAAVRHEVGGVFFNLD